MFAHPRIGIVYLMRFPKSKYLCMSVELNISYKMFVNEHYKRFFLITYNDTKTTKKS